MLLNTVLSELHTEGGVVRGVYGYDTTARECSDARLIRARRGVILAGGGFERNEQMRVKYQREPITAGWTTGVVANTGDGIVAAEKLGTALDFMDDAWWGPTIMLPGGRPWFALTERSAPGSIMVNAAGARYMNEALPYVEAAHRMYGGTWGRGPGPGENLPSWLILDQRCRNRYLFAGLQGGQRFPRRWVESGCIMVADSIPELARKAGIDPNGLVGTIERFNRFARIGIDQDFHRGESAYDLYYSDPTNRPNPSLGEIKHAPYFAVRMVPGDVGTKGGIRTDVHARALRTTAA